METIWLMWVDQMPKSLGAILGNFRDMVGNWEIFLKSYDLLPVYLPLRKLCRDQQFRHLVILCRSKERLGASTGNYSIHHCYLTQYWLIFISFLFPVPRLPLSAGFCRSRETSWPPAWQWSRSRSRCPTSETRRTATRSWPATSTRGSTRGRTGNYTVS